MHNITRIALILQVKTSTEAEEQWNKLLNQLLLKLLTSFLTPLWALSLLGKAEPAGGLRFSAPLPVRWNRAGATGPGCPEASSWCCAENANGNATGENRKTGKNHQLGVVHGGFYTKTINKHPLGLVGARKSLFGCLFQLVEKWTKTENSNRQHLSIRKKILPFWSPQNPPVTASTSSVDSLYHLWTHPEPLVASSQIDFATWLGCQPSLFWQEALSMSFCHCSWFHNPFASSIDFKKPIHKDQKYSKDFIWRSKKGT